MTLGAENDIAAENDITTERPGAKHDIGTQPGAENDIRAANDITTEQPGGKNDICAENYFRGRNKCARTENHMIRQLQKKPVRKK